MNKKFKAFSLVELIIVIAIVGLLAAIAVPSYRNYSSRVLITSALPVLDGIKTKSLAYYHKNSVWPTALSDLDVDTVDSLDTNVITSFGMCPSPAGCGAAIGANGDYAGEYGFYVRLDPAILNLPATATAPTLIYSVEIIDNQVVWYCTTDSATVDVTHNIIASMLPSGCVSPD